MEICDACGFLRLLGPLVNGLRGVRMDHSQAVFSKESDCRRVWQRLYLRNHRTYVAGDEQRGLL